MKHTHLLIFLLLICFNNGIAQANDTAMLRLNNYREKVFSVFNRCNSLDEKITIAIKAKNINDTESGRLALLQCTVDGMKQLDTMENFNGDPALKFSCRDVLKFYKQLAESDLPQIRDFFIVEENFFKIKKEFEKRKIKKHSQSEIIIYNSEANKYNQAITRYTQMSGFIEGARKLTLYNWNASVKIFMDSHKAKSS